MADTDLAQAIGRITWLIPQGERGRFKLRGEVGAMSVGNFDALPPELRFYAGGDRSLRGFDYHEIGEVSANGNIIGGEFLAVASAEYEYYFTENWGAGVFVDAGDAFTNGFSLNVGAGVGIRWRSPLGPIRVDVGFPVQSEISHRDFVALARVAGAGPVKAPSFKKVLWWGGGSFVLLLVLIAGLLAWLLFTTSGARWVAATVTSRFAPQVKYARIDGTIAGELTVEDFQFDGGADKARISIQSMTVDPTLMMLFSRALRIDNARVSGLTLVLPPEKDEPEPEEPLWIEPPLDMTVTDFQLADATIYRQKEKLATIRRVGLSARWKSRELVIESLAVKPGDIEGDLVVSGRITPEGDTVRAALKAQWKEVVVPEKLAGRVLASRGEIDIEGTPKAYAVKGALDVGPPNELVHILIDASGTDARADLRQLELRQSAGHLALSGTVEFKPVAWSLYAKASDFNPGALFAEWPGRLNIDASTRGVLAEGGPRGSLQIATLSGTLRGRPDRGRGRHRIRGAVEARGRPARVFGQEPHHRERLERGSRPDRCDRGPRRGFAQRLGAGYAR